MSQENGPECGSVRQSEKHSQGPTDLHKVIYLDFLSAQTAKRARLDRAIEESNERGLYDNAPNDPIRQQAYIVRLVNAFNSIETEGDNSIIDKPCKNGKLSQAALKFQQGRYPAYAIEEVCWEILEKARIAQMDVRLLDIFHDAKFEGILIHASFGQRWTAIVDACTRSKALCKMLLDAPYLERFVSHPQAELKMKLNNKKINAQRDEQNEIGRTFLSKGLGKEEAVEALAKLHHDNSFDVFDVRRSRAGLVTPAAPVRIQPARAASSSTKRKREYASDDEYDDEYDDDNDVYNDSAVRSSMESSAKMRRSTLKTPTRSTTHHPVMDSTPRSKKAKPTSTVAREPRYNEITPRKSQAEMDAETEERYKKIICTLLEIDEDNPTVRQCSLEELRYYARAYNSEFRGTTWTHRAYPGCSGLGYAFTDEKGIVQDHFCRVIKSFMSLARYRGDFFNNTLNMSHNKMFQPRLSTDREALGVTANTFGFHFGYPGAVNMESHGGPGMPTANSSYTASSPAATQMRAYPPYGQSYYPRQGTYNQSSLQYPSYGQTHSSRIYTPLPQSYGSTSRSYSQENSFPPVSLGNQQSFGSHAPYGAGYGYNSHPSGLYDHDNSYASHPSAYAPLRGVNRFATPHTSLAGYTSGFAAPNPDYSPMIGQSPANMTADHIMGSLGTPHHSASSSSEYPDPNECSNQTQEQ